MTAVCADNFDDALAHQGDYPFTDEDFESIRKKIHSLCGIVLRPEKKGMVYARLLKRIKLLNLNSFSEYLFYIKNNEEQELVHLVNSLTTNLTRFFRENHHFDHLANVVMQDFIKENEMAKDPKFRIWSAASSSGEEPYSIAMTILGTLTNKSFLMKNTKILATDIDTQMIEKGTKGTYTTSDLENIPVHYKKYVTKVKEDVFSMDENLKKLITFKQLNLLDAWPFQGPFDAVFCRNVVIYFDKDTQRILFDKIAEVLKPNGWLYIGHSESLFRVSDRFELIGQTIYRKVY